MEQDNQKPLPSENGPSDYEPFGRPPVPAAEELPLKQSGLGIASFVIGLICIIGLIGTTLFIGASVADFVTPDGTALSEAEIQAKVMDNMGFIVAVLLFMASLFLSLVGLILGIIGLVVKNRRKVFAVIGTVLNGLLIVGFVGLVIIGLAMS
jgi:hypothetical protein